MIPPGFDFTVSEVSTRERVLQDFVDVSTGGRYTRFQRSRPERGSCKWRSRPTAARISRRFRGLDPREGTARFCNLARQLILLSFRGLDPREGTARKGVYRESELGHGFRGLDPREGTARKGVQSRLIMGTEFQRSRPERGSCKRFCSNSVVFWCWVSEVSTRERVLQASLSLSLAELATGVSEVSTRERVLQELLRVSPAMWPHGFRGLDPREGTARCLSIRQ